jgi:hypothetical protein
MFMLCVLYSKGQKAKPGQSGQRSTDKVQKKKIPAGAWMVVRCVCCQVEVSATGRSLVQRRPTDCAVSLCVIQQPKQ